jgi:hypothetical protein
VRAAEKTREQHGRNKRFRQLISGMPTHKLKARLVAMTAEAGLSIIAVDPAYTSMWGDQHWRTPMATPRRTTTRHDAASIAIGRRALGHPIRRRTTPPPHDQSDRVGHRTVQAGLWCPRARGNPPACHGSCTRCTCPDRDQGTRATSAPKTVRDARSAGQRAHGPPLSTDQER